MKKYLLFLSVFIGVIATACSSASVEPGTNSAKVSSANAANTPSQIVVDSANGAVVSGVVNSVPVAENQPDTPTNSPKLNKDRRLIETSGTPPPQQRVPAAENSEISTTMDKQGNFVETRFFKGHPQIDKVERTWLDPTKTLLKISLKNGKVIPVTGAKIDNFATLPASNFLELAGLKAPATPAPGTGAR